MVTEVLINLQKRLSRSEFAIASKLFQADIALFDVVEFDSDLSVRVSFQTYNKRLAVVAKKNGLRVLGRQN